MTDVDNPASRRVRMNAVGIMAGLAVAGSLAIVAAYLIGLSSRTDDIQQSRADNIRIACVQQNERHDRTIATLDRVLEKAREGADAARRRELRQRRESTVLLIRALAPRRNCGALVRKHVGAEEY